MNFNGRKLGELFDHDGYLAQYRGGYTDQDRPIRHHSIAVSNIPAKQHQSIIGRVPYSGNGSTWSGIVSTGWTDIRVICSDWEVRTVDVEIPRPRNGREYGWVWRGSFQQWQKEGFPRCDYCRKYHDPAIPYCQDCGNCHKSDAKMIYCSDCYHCHKSGQCKASS